MIRLLATLSVMALTACFSTSAARDKHAHFHQCPASSISAEDTEIAGEKAVRTSGCGKEEVFYCIGAKCRSPRMLTVRLFSAKHSCSEAEVETSEAAGDIWIASGCGQTGKYRCPRVPRQVVECGEAK